MVITEKLTQEIKNLLQLDTVSNIHNHRMVSIHSIVNIRYVDGTNYIVDYIYYTQDINQIVIRQRSKTLNLINQIREAKLEELFREPIKVIDFEVEDYIYTEEERERLAQLRANQEVKESASLLKVRKEFSESFEVGQKVWYQNNAGFLTFKHQDKESDQITRWSVRIKDTEYRYVNGTELAPRKVEDLSQIEIDPELNKLSTENLLKIMNRKRKVNRGQGDLKIKRILQEREHVRRNENKIIVVN